MSISCRKVEELIVVSGNTYPHKETIKSYGGTFRPSDKCWIVPYSETGWKQVSELCERISGVHSQKSTTAISVASLAKMVAAKVASAFPLPTWVVGEIQNLSESRGNHYLTLAEPKQTHSQSTHTVRAIIWRDKFPELQKKHGAKLLSEILSNGMKVKILANIQLYQSKSEITLHIQAIDAEFTQGEIAIERQKNTEVLKKEGVFARNKTTHLPLFPFRIGLITAAESRAYSDFVHQLNTEPAGVSVLFVPCAMQGENTASDIQCALNALENAACHMIVITRGGGSSADLHWFNDLSLARRITQTQVPVLAAIGHHDDESLAQDVAYEALKTPTALAECILDIFNELRRRLSEMSLSMASTLDAYHHPYIKELGWLQERLTHTTTQHLHKTESQLASISHHLERACSHELTNTQAQLQELIHHFHSTTKDAQNRHEHDLSMLTQTLENLSPLNWIDAGWSPVMKEQKRIFSVKEIHKGDTLKLALKDGFLYAQVTDISQTTGESS